jgi:hypothetical protein
MALALVITMCIEILMEIQFVSRIGQRLMLF